MARRLRGWGRADDDTDSFPVLTEEQVDERVSDDEPSRRRGVPDEEAAPVPTTRSRPPPSPRPKREVPAWVKRFGDAVVARLPRLSAAIVGGMLLCLSFPPFGWWYAAIVAFALLAWVLTRRYHHRWSADSATASFSGRPSTFRCCRGPVSWSGSCRGWRSRSCRRCFPRCSGFAAVFVARRLTGWPIWFAGLWALAEWAKSTVPFGGFPWGVVGFGQTDGPLLPLAQIGGAPLVSFAVTLLGFGLAALVFEIFAWWRRGGDGTTASTRGPRSCCPVPASASC